MEFPIKDPVGWGWPRTKKQLKSRGVIPRAPGPRVRLVLQQGRTEAAAQRGRDGGLGLAVAELELEATHAYALIMSSGSMQLANINEAGQLQGH